jgi:hypothetical protein
MPSLGESGASHGRIHPLEQMLIDTPRLVAGPEQLAGFLQVEWTDSATPASGTSRNRWRQTPPHDLNEHRGSVRIPWPEPDDGVPFKTPSGATPSIQRG